MSSTLAQLRDRVEQILFDTGNSIWSTGAIDEALRLALHEYTLAAPLHIEALLTLPGDGREIALDSLTDLLNVTEIWWPYNSTSAETWPPNRITGYRIYWDDARPVLILDSPDSDQPQQNDELRIWYTRPQTIQNLDSAAVTTLPTQHESIIVLGAAGFAALSRAIDRTGELNIDPKVSENARIWANARIMQFRDYLERIAHHAPRSGPSISGSWKLDQWDT